MNGRLPRPHAERSVQRAEDIREMRSGHASCASSPQCPSYLPGTEHQPTLPSGGAQTEKASEGHLALRPAPDRFQLSGVQYPP